MTRRRLLILGGTREAHELAARAAALPGIEVVSSLAGRTRAPQLPDGNVRRGGFGGADGLARYLDAAAIDAVIDATHPFAATISRHAAEACAAAGRPRLMLVRPLWRREPGDHWIEVADMAGAAAALDGLAARVFLAIGRQELAAFAGRRGIWFLVRLVEPPEAPLPLDAYELVLGRGPFAVADEIELLRSRRIGALVSKNSGGEATYAKIAAARALGLPVVMVRRPALPEGETAASVDDAVAWLARLG
jgi:precorrin-6A/cobalt-precorrin-6A reductase